MNKKILLDRIIAQLKDELSLITEAAKNTYDIATHEENKPENEYDTRGLEASYLAGAQAERVVEMKEALVLLDSLKIKSYDEEDVISLSALVDLDLNGKKQTVFLLPKAGGFKIFFENKNIHVVTPNSPLGEALVGLKVGDVAIIDEAGGGSKEYEIMGVC